MKDAFHGKSIIVTGASRGIGRGIARSFAASGGRVMLAARNEADLEAAIGEITAAGGTARGTACDVGDWASVQRLVEETARAFGGVDVLCANAGTYPQTRMADMDPGEWDEVLRTNLTSNFLCVKACLPQFARRPGGRVVLTSSITGPFTAFPGFTHYGASKAGQLGFMRVAAMELARHGATINAVLPGTVLTEGLAANGQAFLNSAAAGIPLGRLGTVEDIANSVMFLASDYASYVTGQTIVVDGGQILPETSDAVGAI
ncbi:3-oxoacyl-ACP reductase FabG [Albidovulum sp.]|jgi:3-oxoacyl-[acyl-carrier protein] reductase|uniref:3-oxoacyl-ACP reductase FabG n=1 Tax=Albidovulum sp. TaxID=1872424 RepID=UPI0030265264